ncbi:MAG: ATP-binding protein [Spirochaetes bacterium]|nr:ATP-binding protein [Spirochaetota bacterium]
MTLEQFRKSDIVLVCGLPGSGKSYFAKKYFAKSGCKRVSRKNIRQYLYEMLTFGDKWSDDKFDLVDENLVKHLERKTAEHFLQLGEKILIDNMSISSASRKDYITLAKQNKKTISAIFINTDIATCLKRNRERPPEDVVADSVIANLVATVEYPDRREGFKDVLIIDKFEDGLK